MKIKVCIQTVQLVKLFFVASPKLVDDSLFAVYHLVVGKGEEEQVVIKIAHREEQLVFVRCTLLKRSGKVIKGVVHPTQVPLVVKAKPAINHRSGDLDEVAGILGNQHHLWVVLGHGIVGGAQKPKPGLIESILLPAVVVDEVGDRIIADAVKVVDRTPEIQRGAQKAEDVRLGEIEQRTSPLAESGVRVVRLIQAGAVELQKSVAVQHKVGGHKIQNHSDARPVAAVDKLHQPDRRAVAAGGAEIAGHLIPPRGVQRMLGERKQLDVGVAHLLHILDQRLRQLVVGVKAFTVRFVLDPPGTGVQLIDVHGAVIVFLPLRHISLVLPAVSLQKADDRGSTRAQLAAKGKRVGAVHELPVRCGDLVFIHLTFLRFGRGEGPNPAVEPLHLPGLPAVKCTNEGDILRIGSIDREADFAYPVFPYGVCAKLPVAV